MQLFCQMGQTEWSESGRIRQLDIWVVCEGLNTALIDPYFVVIRYSHES